MTWRTSRLIPTSVWDEIAADSAPTGFVRRRLLPHLPHEVFVGETRPRRERVLLLEINGAPLGLPTRHPSSKGLDVVVDEASPDQTRIRLTSTSAAGDPVFAELADDVVGVLAEDPGHGAAARVLTRVIAWQAFFAQRREQFTVEKAAGLFSELVVLKKVILPALGSAEGVVAWIGPDPAIQDFQRGGLVVEVKSFRGNGPGRLLISSERQLDLVGLSDLYVAYVRLDQRQEGPGITLADLIEDVRKSIADSTFADQLFREKLLNYGWHDSAAELRRERYEVRSNELFEVVDGFPRIVPDDLALGVSGVSYSVERSAIEAFLRRWDTLIAKLKEEVA